jgi:REP element-mobilizing transposase RayT
MSRSLIVLPIHFVWATQGRMEWITPEWEPRIYTSIRTQAKKMGCEVLALGGMPDHIHLAVLFGSSVSVGEFMKQIKGATSRLVREVLAEESPFYWQEGYGAFGFHRAFTPKVVHYIENQKRHHASGKIWHSLEAITTEA